MEREVMRNFILVHYHRCNGWKGCKRDREGALKLGDDKGMYTLRKVEKMVVLGVERREEEQMGWVDLCHLPPDHPSAKLSFSRLMDLAELS